MVFYPTLWQRPFELFRGWPLERFLTSKKNKEGTFQNSKKIGFCKTITTYVVRIYVFSYLTTNNSFSPNLMYGPACNIYFYGKSEKCNVVPSLQILRIFSMKSWMLQLTFPRRKNLLRPCEKNPTVPVLESGLWLVAL